MVQFNNFDRVMETGDHFKNGASSKSLNSRRNQFNRYFFLFIFLLYSFLLKAQFDNKKYDKECFLIGTLNEYMGYQRTFTNEDAFYYQRIDIMGQSELRNALFIDSLFNMDYSDITIVNNGASQGIKIYSPTLSLKIDNYYNYAPSGRGNANEWDEKTVFISGEITNNSGGDRTVKFIFRDLLSLDEIMVVQLDENNSFQVSFPVAYPQDFYIEYGRGNLGTIFCSPGDTLFIKINADYNSQTDSDENRFISVVKGPSKYKQLSKKSGLLEHTLF